MLVIRSATLADAASIASVQVETWQAAYRGVVADAFLDAMSQEDREERWAEILKRPGHATFVAEVDSARVVGFANGGPDRDEDQKNRGELCGLYVHPNWQQRGIGTRLIAEFADWLLATGRDSMIVWTLEESPFRRFYERLGGKLAGEAQIEIGEEKLAEVAYAWEEVRELLP